MKKTFADFKLSKPLQRALDELRFEQPTPIQEKSFSAILGGKDLVGIAQTGTGKTLAYILPVLHGYRFSDEVHPSTVILVPTRELVDQVVERARQFAQYTTARIEGVYGGVNMSTQMEELAGGMDILVATPGRLYDLVIARGISLKKVRRVVIDEVDVMLELGFRPQLNKLFDLLPERRQHVMFSATMTTEVDEFIHKFFWTPKKITIAVSGTPLDKIEQVSYPVPNFYTKVNLLEHLLIDKETFSKVLIFSPTKKHADLIYELLEPVYGSQSCVVHSNKSQNYRTRSVSQFESGEKRILITTDIMARGLDLSDISHVISVDVPPFPENYMHRIGRTGRAEKEGHSILLYSPREEDDRLDIEMLMDYEIPILEFPEDVEVNPQLLPEERPKIRETYTGPRRKKKDSGGGAFHEKKAKNQKQNLGGPTKRKVAKYKKPKTRGDKNFRQGKKNKKRW